VIGLLFDGLWSIFILLPVLLFALLSLNLMTSRAMALAVNCAAFAIATPFGIIAGALFVTGDASWLAATLLVPPVVVCALAVFVAAHPRLWSVPLDVVILFYLTLLGVLTGFTVGIAYLLCAYLIFWGTLLTLAEAINRSRRGDDYWRQVVARTAK
jgi:hypothetical protein